MPAYDIRATFRSSVPAGDFAKTLFVNVIHFQLAALSSVSNWSNIANEIMTAYGTEYRNVLTDSMTMHDITVTTEEAPGGTPSQGVHSVELAGTRSQADASLGPSQCILLSAKTNTPKRYARGHIFLPPGLNASSVTSHGTWSSSNAYWTTATALKNKLASSQNVGDNTYTYEIYSKTQRSKGFTPFAFPVTTILQDPTVHVLRRRLTAP